VKNELPPRLTPATVARLREVVEERRVAGELRGGDPSASDVIT
jgi:hypothetical protein